MRKLRAWNSIMKKWLFKGLDICEITDAINNDLLSECEVTEHTGLYINNEPIYCGDILENNIGLRGLIEFHNAGFVWKYKNLKGAEIYSSMNDGFLKNKKLIGNIYENKHLLDADTDK